MQSQEPKFEVKEGILTLTENLIDSAAMAKNVAKEATDFAYDKAQDVMGQARQAKDTLKKNIKA